MAPPKRALLFPPKDDTTCQHNTFDTFKTYQDKFDLANECKWFSEQVEAAKVLE